ncbi:uncharacterized protein LOC133374439 [Rhineura floridana]|uniref:uncharacterized protein LOC133374439 n=1 Tax=Rhineura floridana TaxID=261503 RepID=UPI002AC83D4D|nr:uncharacterized protein LOC133374439 [Rhineura floridana]
MEEKARGVSGRPRASLFCHDQAFSISWFNACLQETLLPGKPWHKVLERLETAFADEIKHQIRDPKQREMAFHLLGQSFVRRYFSDCPIQPESLSSRDMSEINKMKLEKATKVWLQNQCFKAAENIHCRFRLDFQLHIRPELHPPVLSCPESDLLRDLLCAIISRDSKNMSAACESLSGKLLPRSLRQFIWIDKLLRANTERHKTEGLMSTEREGRGEFGQTIARQMAELKLQSATRSPLSGLIENAVVEKYRSIPCMCPFATNEQMILETSKSLNVLYVFDGTYEPYLINWLFPLQMAFEQITSRAEHPYELAMYLHSLHQNLFPTWGKIFVIAESVMSLLEKEDTELFAHLQRAFRKNITVDPKDFLVELILQERESTQGTCVVKNGFQPRPNKTKELLASPVVFLRKWMGEGFVGVLNLPAVLFVWDQLFTQDWNPDVMQNVCASVLLLLKNSFMAADDYPAVQQVFLSSPSRLLTADIQRAWIYLQQGGLPADVPGLNRLNQREELKPSGRACAWHAEGSAFNFQVELRMLETLKSCCRPCPTVLG